MLELYNNLLYNDSHIILNIRQKLLKEVKNMIPYYEVQPDRLKIIHNHRELSFPPHIHDNIEILYVNKGTQHISINNIKYKINEQDVAIIFPNLLHEYYKDDKKNADGTLIICDPKIFLNMFPNLTQSTPKNPVIKNNTLNKEAVFALDSINAEKPFPINLGFVYVLMHHILDNLDIINKQNFYPENITKKIIEYITKNFTNPITLDIMAKDLCVSKYYISRIFSDKIKINFRNYIGITRAEYAAKLIRITNDSLTEISANAGFESQRTFNRIFRSVYGCSPRDYKYSHKNNKCINNSKNGIIDI